MKKETEAPFELTIIFSKRKLVLARVRFENCSTAPEVRTYINKSNGWLSIGNNIINMNNVLYLYIKRSELQDCN